MDERFGSSGFMGGVEGKEEVVGEEMPMAVAAIVEFC
jgi:hypothetical protein